MPVRPAKAEPLLPVWLEKAYRISLKPCGPGVQRAGHALGQDAREGREAEDAGAQDEGDEHRHLDLERLDLLAEVLGRPADHQAGDEHGQDRADDQHAVHAGADAARRDLAELHVEQRDEAGDRLERCRARR